MTPEQFVECCAAEKALLLKQYLGDAATETAVGASIAQLQLSPAQRRTLEAVLDGVLTDAFYTFLLAIDGCASLGGKQRRHALFDEDGTKLSGSLEGLAFERFQAQASE